MSLAEIKQAVHELSPKDLTELASFIREQDDKAWDAQIDSDFAKGGKFHEVLSEVRNDFLAGNSEDLP